jgi:hypothetical protein
MLLRITPLLFCLIAVAGSKCIYEPDTSSSNQSSFLKTLYSGKSPDGRKELRLIESGYDSTDCYTQVLIDFGTTGAGVYAPRGINLGVRTYW